MRHVRVALVALVLAGCGAEEAERVKPAGPVATATAGTITLDLRARPEAWPALPGGTLRLPSSQPEKVVLDQAVGPPARVEAEIVLPSRGRAGVHCGQYAFAVAADGTYALYRDTKPVVDGRLEPGARSDPGEPTLVRLLCDGRRVGFMVNAGPIQFARDSKRAAPSGIVGAFGIGPGGDAKYLAFAASESAG